MFAPRPGAPGDGDRVIVGHLLEAPEDPPMIEVGQDAPSFVASRAVPALSGHEKAVGPVEPFDPGSDLRTSPDYTLIFERVNNTVIACRPGIRLCSNDSPETTLDALRRGVTR